jgi:ferredoxin
MAKMSRVQEVPWVDEAVQPREVQQTIGNADSWRINLYHIPWVRAVLASRWPQLIMRLITLLGFVFTLVAAQLGPRVGSRNFAIIMVWIAWWTTLKLVFIPFGGRSWCSICPIALPGEWLQHGGMLGEGELRHGLNLRWPKALRGSWLQSGGFLLIGIFSAVTLTDPQVTGWVLLGIFILAIGMSLVFEHRAFCSHMCPIGGFSGMYAKAAPLEVHVLEKEICAKHEDKLCYQACPWGIYPLAMKDSSTCGLCMECLRVCPKDNLALNIRPFSTDLNRKAGNTRLDETFLALIMIGSTLAFSAVFLGPWGWLKLSAFHIGSSQWLIYVLSFLAVNLVFLPGLFSLCVWLWKKISHNRQALKGMIATESQGLIPLGLMAWIAFTISFALPKLSYIAGVLNDPLGLGWHILGASIVAKSLDVSTFSHVLVVVLILVGAIWAASITHKIARSSHNTFPNLPVLAFYALYSTTLMWLLVG